MWAAHGYLAGAGPGARATPADASPIPLLIYNVPAFTGIDFAPATLLANRPDFQVFAGTGGVLLDRVKPFS